MCECGCSDVGLGPAEKCSIAGDVFVARIYPGCSNCDAPIGIDLYRMTPGKDRFTDESIEQFAEAPEMPWHPTLPGFSEVALPVIHPDDLAAALKEELGFDAEAEGVEDHELFDVLSSAVRKTWERYAPERRSASSINKGEP
jgi:hypothetical protein